MQVQQLFTQFSKIYLEEKEQSYKKSTTFATTTTTTSMSDSMPLSCQFVTNLTAALQQEINKRKEALLGYVQVNCKQSINAFNVNYSNQEAKMSKLLVIMPQLQKDLQKMVHQFKPVLIDIVRDIASHRKSRVLSDCNATQDIDIEQYMNQVFANALNVDVRPHLLAFHLQCAKEMENIVSDPSLITILRDWDSLFGMSFLSTKLPEKQPSSFLSYFNPLSYVSKKKTTNACWEKLPIESFASHIHEQMLNQLQYRFTHFLAQASCNAELCQLRKQHVVENSKYGKKVVKLFTNLWLQMEFVRCNIAPMKLEQVIGRGSYSVVYSGVLNNEPVAVKHVDAEHFKCAAQEAFMLRYVCLLL